MYGRIVRLLGINLVTISGGQQAYFIYIKQAFISILKKNTQNFLINSALYDTTVSDMRLDRPSRLT